VPFEARPRRRLSQLACFASGAAAPSPPSRRHPPAPQAPAPPRPPGGGRASRGTRRPIARRTRRRRSAQSRGAHAGGRGRRGGGGQGIERGSLASTALIVVAEHFEFYECGFRFCFAGQDASLSPERPGLEPRWRKLLGDCWSLEMSPSLAP